jgi:type I restriction enzyme M protein
MTWPWARAGSFWRRTTTSKQKQEKRRRARSICTARRSILARMLSPRSTCFCMVSTGADVQRGDTLADPKFQNPDGSLKTFDICVANPPYSISEWEYEIFKHDKHGRVAGYEMPPTKKADYAFVLHMVKSMNTNGRAGIVLPHGVLFRGAAEGRIREQLIKDDLIEAVIALPPKLFYGTGIPAAIMIFNKNKPESHRNKIIIIDAEKDFEEGKNQNRLRKKDIEKIVTAFEGYRNIEKYARVVDIKELEGNEFNLNVRRYVEMAKMRRCLTSNSSGAKWRRLKKSAL